MPVLRFKIGQKIRALRLAAQMSQGELALAVGLTQTTISNVERGETPTDVDTIETIAGYFKVEAWELLTDKKLQDHGVGECARRVYEELKPKS